MKNILGKKADYVSPEIISISVFTDDVLLISGKVGLEEFDNIENSINFGI